MPTTSLTVGSTLANEVPVELVVNADLHVVHAVDLGQGQRGRRSEARTLSSAVSQTPNPANAYCDLQFFGTCPWAPRRPLFSDTELHQPAFPQDPTPRSHKVPHQVPDHAFDLLLGQVDILCGAFQGDLVLSFGELNVNLPHQDKMMSTGVGPATPGHRQAGEDSGSPLGAQTADPKVPNTRCGPREDWVPRSSLCREMLQ